MLGAVRRPTACASLFLMMLGCTSVRRTDPAGVIRADGSMGRNKIVGATLTDGRELRFDINSSTLLRADTLRTSVGKQPTRIAVSDLRELWVESTNVRKTTLLLVGLGALFLAVGAVAAQSMDYGAWPTNE